MKKLDEMAGKTLSRAQPAESKATERKVNVRRNKFIQKSKFDKEAEADLDDIRTGKEDMIRPAIKIPASRYADVKTVLALKRQTMQEYLWSLVLADLDRLERSGEFQPPRKETDQDTEDDN